VRVAPACTHGCTALHPHRRVSAARCVERASDAWCTVAPVAALDAPLAMSIAPPERLPVRVAAMAWRQLRRDLRAGELRLLLVAVLRAVAALTAVGFFANRLNLALARDARALLGGDAIIVSDQTTPPAFAARAAELRLRTATQAAFPSMARAPDDRGGAARL